jgi:1,4-alpha-glucan branching enzyme
MITTMPSLDPHKVVVRFELPSAIWADSVDLVGDFDGCNETSHPMVFNRTDGVWAISPELEQGKEYQFRYLVNGREWHNDWGEDTHVPNPRGGTCSVVLTAPSESQEGR